MIILGSGPNRIGQGIEFDYSCVHATLTLREAGYEAIMVNCNPETVSTDYDTANRLYFEPLTLEDVLEVITAEQAVGPVAGVICQLGGQTPLGLAARLKAEGAAAGNHPEAIHLAEERGAFGQVLHDAGLPVPKHGMACSVAEAEAIAAEIGYPVLVRPSYVLGGRGMEIVYDKSVLASYIERATQASPEHPVLVDQFLDDAIEIDVDALYDGEELFLGGVMEHIEEAGIHSGDSACACPYDAWSPRTRTDPGQHVGHRARCGGAWAAQHPVRADPGQTVRPGGQPRARRGPCPSCRRRPACRWPKPRPGSPSGRASPSCAPMACCRQRRHGGTAGGCGDVGEGSGHAVRPFPRRGQCARPGNAFDR